MVLRMTIARLIVVVFLASICLAALANPSPFWAVISPALTLMALLTGTLGCLFRRGEARVLWAGFTLFGWGAFAFLFFSKSLNGDATAAVMYSLSTVIHPFDMAKYQAMGDGVQK